MSDRLEQISVRLTAGYRSHTQPFADAQADVEWLLDEVERLRARLDACQLRYIEATNPGIDMDDVKLIRRIRAHTTAPDEADT